MESMHNTAEEGPYQGTALLNEDMSTHSNCNGNNENNHLNSLDNNGLSLTMPTKRKRRSVNHMEYVQPDQKKRTKEKQVKSKEEETEVEFEEVWICTECKETECMMQPESTELLICEGVCRRGFHYPCAGLASLPGDDETFVCKDCLNRKHVCSLCSNYGVDNEDVFKCSHSKCGLFFHESCLQMQNVDVETPTQKESSDHTEAVEKSAEIFFVCPAHSCWTCTQSDLKKQETDAHSSKGDGKKKKRGRQKKKTKQSSIFESKSDKFLTRCIECPIAYHVSCIPPSSRFHELATLCHEHASTCKLPELDAKTSLQKKIEIAADCKLAGLVKSSTRRKKAQVSGGNKFFPGLSGSKRTRNENELLEALKKNEPESVLFSAVDRLFFCLPCDLKDEVHSKPPSYHHVNSLQFSASKPPRTPTPDDFCQCVNHCGEDCINKMLYTECFGNAATSKSGKNDSNCNVGLNCGNRQLGQRKAAKCKPDREKGKGWGLRLLNKSQKGDLIQEYVGAVVDAKRKEKILLEWSQEHPNDPNFYVMALQPGWFIDARDVANLSRFINHSCEPNCSLTQINVNGRIRCGIFALRDIEANEFLSYDYHFDTIDGDKFVCCCGSLICRGTMKGGVHNTTNANRKNKAEVWEDAKTAYERDKKFLAEFHLERVNRRSQVDELVPGADTGSKDEFVANGPHMKHRAKAHSNRIFLWRNAIQGGDFVARIKS